MHVCTECGLTVEEHSEVCECGCGSRFFPALCCEGCDCRSFEDAHLVEVDPDDLKVGVDIQ